MHYSPPPQDEYALRAVADAHRERAQKSGLSGMPTSVLLVVLPFVLVARLSAFAWRRGLRPLYLRLRSARAKRPAQHEEFLARIRRDG
jgi:hypothetical protein